MSHRYRSLVSRAYFPVALLLAGSGLILVALIKDVTTAVQGFYSMVGIALAAGLYYGTRQYTGSSTPIPRKWCLKGIVIIFCLALAAIGFTGSRLVVLVLGLPVGYTLLLIGLHTDTPAHTGRWIAAIAALFMIAPIGKFLSTGFYLGNGDYRAHIPIVRQLMSTGSLTAVSSNYQNFPGLHLLTSTVGLLTGLSPYEAIMTLGIVVYVGLLIPVVFVLARLVTQSTTMALAVTVGMTLLSAVPFYSTYVFPQSVAVPLGILFLYVTFWRTANPDRQMASNVLFVVVGPAIFLTHHLTLLLFAPLLILLFATTTFFKSGWRATPPDRTIAEPAVVPWLGLFAASFIYWNVWGENFLYMTSVYLEAALQLDLHPASETLFTYGVSPPPSTVQSALAELLYPPMVYYTLLLTLLILGGRFVITHWERYTRAIGLLLPGIVGAVVVLRTPLPIVSIQRLELVMVIFVAFLVGAAIYHLMLTSPHHQISLILVLVVSTATVTPFVHPGDDLYQLHPEPQPQRDFEEDEYAQLKAAGHFVQARGTPTWVATLTNDIFRVHDISSSTRGVTLTRTGIRTPPGLFVYRHNWADHLVYFGRDGISPSGELSQLHRALFADDYIKRISASENKVYDAGKVGITWSDDTGVVGSQDHSPATVEGGEAYNDSRYDSMGFIQ